MGFLYAACEEDNQTWSKLALTLNEIRDPVKKKGEKAEPLDWPTRISTEGDARCSREC